MRKLSIKLLEQDGDQTTEQSFQQSFDDDLLTAENFWRTTLKAFREFGFDIPVVVNVGGSSLIYNGDQGGVQGCVQAKKADSDTIPQEQFKPINQMTLYDWEQALDEGWVFEVGDCEGGTGLHKVDRVDWSDTDLPVRLSEGSWYSWYSIKGEFRTNCPDPDLDILKRIR